MSSDKPTVEHGVAVFNQASMQQRIP